MYHSRRPFRRPFRRPPRRRSRPNPAKDSVHAPFNYPAHANAHTLLLLFLAIRSPPRTRPPRGFCTAPFRRIFSSLRAPWHCLLASCGSCGTGLGCLTRLGIQNTPLSLASCSRTHTILVPLPNCWWIMSLSRPDASCRRCFTGRWMVDPASQGQPGPPPPPPPSQPCTM
ncbi:hypothetical protein IF1G_07862 [Cordyceps javanica]|uniref:Uncharacterized protein n=1 Tax=Cordyceps javanica TaxID=43265 RepID=A0A545UUZ6_9HYPO|nr:hypothetical protein IF1G_07862 [Cordyceps javanica]